MKKMREKQLYQLQIKVVSVINTRAANISGINDVVSSVEALININSISDKEGLMADALESWLKQSGWSVLHQNYVILMIDIIF